MVSGNSLDQGRGLPVLFLAATLGACIVAAHPAAAATPTAPRPNLQEGTSSESARKDAVAAIPLDKIDREDRAKVESVLANTSIFRRMPTRVVDCDPTMYLFLVRHPDVVVNIWELMNVSRLQLKQTDENRYQVIEPAGAVARFSYVYRSHDMHVLYGEGKYDGPLMARPAKGRGVLVLKCGYVRETDGRYYITSRLDSFVTIEPAGIELLGKTISPLVSKTVDNNFIQTVSFLGTLSRTAETNGVGVQRLAAKLKNVQPDVREQFADLVGKMGDSSPTADASAAALPSARLAGK
jgi:hypothetical protein